MYRKVIPRIKTNTSGTCNTPSALSTLFQGVVNTRSTVNETDVLTRNKRNSAVIAPVCVMTNPSGKCASGGPGVIKNAGMATIPVKNGMNSHTRLTKKPMGTDESHASIRVTK